MDTLAVLKAKVERLSHHGEFAGAIAVVRHIGVAESHLERATTHDEPSLFTDAIYRTNQSFEGVLKEAYAVLADTPGQHKTPHQIEHYFAENEIFHPRVLELFTQYRLQWRNPSTHDYQLVFSEQEATLAILSVTAFVVILLDQVLERLSFNEEKARSAPIRTSVTQKIDGFESLPLVDKVAELLLRLSDDVKKWLSRSRSHPSGAFGGRGRCWPMTGVWPALSETTCPARNSSFWFVNFGNRTPR